MTHQQLDISDLTPTQSNILAVYIQSTTVERQQGKEWYDRAHNYACVISSRYNCEVEAVCGVIAALSPNTKWEQNLTAAEELVDAYTYGTPLKTLRLPCYKANVLKAWDILHGEPPLNVLGGNKVRNFYLCMMHDRTAVCIDGHAYCVAHGIRLGVKQIPRLTTGMYACLRHDYTTVASLLGIPARELQATTWLTWKRVQKI
jgi:hypothetical protein